jgi:hypothetical protein
MQHEPINSTVLGQQADATIPIDFNKFFFQVVEESGNHILSSINGRVVSWLFQNDQNDDNVENQSKETTTTRTKRRNTSTILPKTSMLKVSNRNTTRGNTASANTATNANLLITDETETESNSLYVQVLNSQASILTIVDDWIEVFSF